MLRKPWGGGGGGGGGAILRTGRVKDSFLKELSGDYFEISINTLSMPSPSFALDICLIPLLTILMHKCNNYSKTWRCEYNHSKSCVATFVETKPIHCKPMREHEGALGDDMVEEL